MFFASKILALITQPLTWAILVLFVALWLPAHKVQLMKRLIACAVVLVLAMGWQPLPDFFIRQLENHYPESSADTVFRGYAGVVVLGGALDSGHVAQARLQPVLNSAAERMTSVVPLLQHNPQLRMLFTGGEGAFFGTGPTEAERAKLFFDSVGVRGTHVMFESKSRNTYENAILTAQMPGVDKTQRWLLVTSAWHMPRSMATFIKAGWNVQAYPVDFRTGTATPWTSYSLSGGVDKWQLLLHECVGIAAYRLAGRL